jgi:hypothetical protein
VALAAAVALGAEVALGAGVAVCTTTTTGTAEQAPRSRLITVKIDINLTDIHFIFFSSETLQISTA